MIDPAHLTQFILVTITNLHREYPNGLLHHLQSGEDLGTPSQFHPAFYGCYDWHSSVHSHWQVLRALRLFPEAEFAPTAIAALDRSFTPENIAGELAYWRPRPGFEMPYGIAWLLQLMAELRQCKTAHAARWLSILLPMEQLAAERMGAYLNRLSYPIRGGLHNQTAFAMGLTFDWAQTAGDLALLALIRARARHFFLADRNAPLAYEPAAVDFLSPALAEADLMRRVLPQAEFVAWLWQFLGKGIVKKLPKRLAPVQLVNASDGQLAHFAGLNLSRAWMLEGIHAALPAEDVRRAPLLELATQHRTVGLLDAFHEDYMVSHWAPSFAVYLLTGRGMSV